MRVGAHRLGHHLHQLLDMAAAINGHAGLGGQAGIELAAIGPGQFLFRGDIGAVIGIGQFVVIAFPHPADRHPELLQKAHFRLILFVKRLVEQLVMPVFIGRDAAGDFLQHRLVGGVADGGVIGRGAAFHHAAGDHFAPAGAAHRIGVGVGEMGGAIALAEAGKGFVQLEAGIGDLGPAAQRPAMLGFLRRPSARSSPGFRAANRGTRA